MLALLILFDALEMKGLKTTKTVMLPNQAALLILGELLGFRIFW